MDTQSLEYRTVEEISKVVNKNPGALVQVIRDRATEWVEAGIIPEELTGKSGKKKALRLYWKRKRTIEQILEE